MSAWLRLVVLLLALLCGFGAWAENEPTVRVRVQTAAPFVVGRPIDLEIQVLVPNFFLSAPRFPTLDIPGAIVTSDDRALNFTETIGGVTYSGIRSGYAIVPQQPGAFTLPPAHIDFTYAAMPGQSTAGSVTVPPRAFDVVMPAGAAPRVALQISQSFEPDPGRLVAGDVLTRTITIQAAGTPAMTIQPPAATAPRAVRVYRHDPVLADDGGNGRRTERIAYEFPKAGDYLLPPLTAGAASLPEVRVHVVPATAPRNAIAPGMPTGLARLAALDWDFWLPRLLGVLLPMVLIAALWARYGRRTVEVAAAWRQCRRQSEPAYFAKLSSACRTGDAVAVHRALQLWVLRAGIRPLDRWAYRFGAPRLRVEIAGLERDLFSRRPTAGGWTNRSLIAELAAARRNWRGARTGVTRRVLPDLN